MSNPWDEVLSVAENELGITAPAAAAAAAAAPQAPADPPQYTPVYGDTFATIAAAYGVTTEQLCAWNGYPAPDSLIIGNPLRVG